MSWNEIKKKERERKEETKNERKESYTKIIRRFIRGILIC